MLKYAWEIKRNKKWSDKDYIWNIENWLLEFWLTVNTSMLILIFFISIFIHVCFLWHFICWVSTYLWNPSTKIMHGTLQRMKYQNVSQWEISFQNMGEYVYHIHYFNCFYNEFNNVIKYSLYDPMSTLLMKAIFLARHPLFFSNFCCHDKILENNVLYE